MKNNGLPSTLRKLQPMIVHSRLIASYFLVSAACVIVGPFSTYENLSLLGRIPYWAGIIAVCYAIAITVLYFGKKLGFQHTRPSFLNQLLHSLVMAVFIAGFVYIVNLWVWGEIEQLPSFLSYLMLTIPISVVVSVVIYMLGNSRTQETPQTQAAFMKRLPTHLGNELYSISVSDHYVQAVTAKGSHMVLMRFSDAMNEVETIKGVQLHRSHWVALDSIEGITKSNGKMMVKLKNGTTYPVSRSRMQEVKQALNV